LKFSTPPLNTGLTPKRRHSRADSCYENAFMESCFGTIKTELETEVYANVGTARAETRDYLCSHDTQRRHSSLGYLTPREFELSQK
jgi:transposase InsO family protein